MNLHVVTATLTEVVQYMHTSADTTTIVVLY